MSTQRQTAKIGQSATPAQGGLLQRACACGKHTSGGGECADCKQKRAGTLQRKAADLIVGPAGDRFEQEADRVAAAVVGGGGVSGTLGAPSQLQRRTTADDSVSTAPPLVHDVLQSPGQPLDTATRSFMEPRFGHDFSGVRVHTDAKAAESARSVNALAYTVGRDVVFGAGQHAPQSGAGQRLMAHELTHVVQQSGAEGGRVGRSNERSSLALAALDLDRASTALSERNSIGWLQEAALSVSLQREEADEIQAPDLEAVPGAVPGVVLPVASADPSSNSDFIDRRTIAVGVGLSGTDFILICEGIDNPIALPIDYIDLVGANSTPVNHIIYSTREEALANVPYGPPAPGSSSKFAFAYYRAIGGLIVPTTISAASAPETVKTMKRVLNKLRIFAKDITDYLVTSVILFIAGTLVKMGISKWITKRGTLSQQKLQDAKVESMPKKGERHDALIPKDTAAPAKPTTPAAAQEAVAPPLPSTAQKPSAPPGYKGEQYKFGDEIGWPKQFGKSTGKGTPEVPAEKADLGKIRQYGGDEAWARGQAQAYRAIAKKNPDNPTAARRADWLEKVADRLKNTTSPTSGPKTE